MKFIDDTLNIEALEHNSTQTIALYGGAGKASIGHLRFWIPIFEEAKVDFVILTRDMIVYKTLIEEFPLLSITYAKTPLDVEEVINKLSLLKAVFYTSNVGKNIHLLRFNHIRHIYIGSENSEQLSKITKFYRAYDDIYISSESQIDKFRNEGIRLGHLKFIKVGKPYLKDILEYKKKRSKILRISYFPSWEGDRDSHNLSSLGKFSEILYKISSFNNSSLFVKFHNKMGKRDKTLLLFQKRLNEITTFDLPIIEYQKKSDNIDEVDFTLESDIIICDIETLSLKYLALNIPIVLYLPKDKELSLFMEKRYLSYDYTYTFSTIDEFMNILEKLNSNKDRLKKAREEAIGYWIGRDETLSNSFLNNLLDIQKKGID